MYFICTINRLVYTVGCIIHYGNSYVLIMFHTFEGKHVVFVLSVRHKCLYIQLLFHFKCNSLRLCMFDYYHIMFAYQYCSLVRPFSKRLLTVRLDYCIKIVCTTPSIGIPKKNQTNIRFNVHVLLYGGSYIVVVYQLALNSNHSLTHSFKPIF
jgi:hypothetical protein